MYSSSSRGSTTACESTPSQNHWLYIIYPQKALSIRLSKFWQYTVAND